MPLLRAKPTSPGRRFVVSIINKSLHKGRPYHSLVTKKRSATGRNNAGRITVRHRSSGHKKHYRIIDFKRNKIDIPGVVQRIEYDPNRTAYIALILYSDGERRYIISPNGLKAGNTIISSENAPISLGNCLPLHSIPAGSRIHCIELQPGKGAQFIRSAGSSAKLVSHNVTYTIIEMKSGEMRKIDSNCKACIGEVSNSENNLRSLGKAGASRWRGIRPTVRGVAMNPVDHPHGGGEGKTSGGRHPVSPTGVPTKGFKTRRRKESKHLVRDRRK